MVTVSCPKTPWEIWGHFQRTTSFNSLIAQSSPWTHSNRAEILNNCLGIVGHVPENCQLQQSYYPICSLDSF